MTIVISARQRIFYRFEGDKGAYLLLHHGLFGTHQDWQAAGYVDALRNDFRLIVMDARGHGRGDHPLEPEQYGLAQMAEDVVAIMDELEIRNLHFCGYSLGALVGFELLLRHPERVRIVMLAGETPFVSESMQAEWRALAEAVGREGLAAVRARLAGEQRLVALTPQPEQEGEQQAALALLAGLAASPLRLDEGRLSVDSPVAMFTGEADPAFPRMREARRRVHRARFVSFPGQTHSGLFTERTALLGEMLRLLRPVRRPEGEDVRPGQGRDTVPGHEPAAAPDASRATEDHASAAGLFDAVPPDATLLPGAATADAPLDAAPLDSVTGTAPPQDAVAPAEPATGPASGEPWRADPPAEPSAPSPEDVRVRAREEEAEAHSEEPQEPDDPEARWSRAQAELERAGGHAEAEPPAPGDEHDAEEELLEGEPWPPDTHGDRQED